MKKRFNQPLRAPLILVVLFLTQLCLTQTITGKGAYPVKWLDGFGLYDGIKGEKKPQSLADIRRQLGSRWESSYKLSKKGRSVDREVNSCADFFSAREAGDRAPLHNLKRLNYSGMGIDCLAARVILAGKDARKSHIGKLPLDGRLAKFLPAAVKYELRGNVPPPTKGSWADVEKGLKVTGGDSAGPEFETKDAEHLIWLVALGDFNDDGNQDILLRIRHQVKKGSHFLDRLYVMTRFSEKDLLKIVKQYSMYK